MDETKRVEKAKIHLLLDQPFYATFVLELKLKVDESVPTAATDGREILYNPKWTKTLSLDQIKTVLAHEILHVAHCHHIRRSGRNQTAWNLACDFAINPILYNEFAKIDGAAYDPKYNGKAAEMIYPDIKIIEIEIPMMGGSGEGKENPNGSGATIKTKNGEYKDIGGVKDLAEGTSVAEEEARIKETTVRAIQQAKAAGKMPGELERCMKDFMKPQIPWERELASWFSERARNDYSWLRKNTRIKDFYFPSLYSEELGHVVIAVDSSGSVDEHLLNRFISEIRGLKDKYKFELTLLSCDTQVDNKNVEYYTANQPLTKAPNIRGGGGTAFTPVFRWVEKKGINPIGLIYFTDLYCSDFPNKQPQYDTLWINYGSDKSDHVPFGKVLDIKSR